ncbi:excisionase family DNA binding protein [Kitasatospora sp. GAS204A]|uniref:helix-turn-helix domain-containing protein n=1 Tax=unclassified Kitasatospora TaxID=2633591 RepID=UPI002476B59D|nr:helix-turn-helix domain-containing protein [Kitasatospora sp. GAS204B]MDH6119306.1 excisionase family DNA binding protein [Kitasatospora sp. GAS204B]
MSRHSVTAVTANPKVGDRGTLPTLFLPSDVAEALGMSEWWVKEQARKGRIPYTKPGRAYRFTAEQVAEIFRLFQSRPTGVSEEAAPAPTAPRRQGPLIAAPVTTLKARVPRRAQRNQLGASAA